MSQSTRVAGDVEPGGANVPVRRAGGHSRRAWAVLVVLVLLAALAVRPRLAESVDLSGDEAEYLRIAAQLATHGVLSDHRLESTPGRPTAFREPLYPLVLGLAAQLERSTTHSEGVRDVLSPASSARRTLLLMQWLLLLAAALAAAWWAVETTGSTVVGGVAAVAIATSPALVQASGSISTEAIAAPLTLFAAVSLARSLKTPDLPWLVAVAATFGLLATTRLGYLPLGPLALGLVAAAWPAGRRGRALLLFAAISALPAGLWAARNLFALGAPTLDEGRGAFNLLVRAELDRQIREGEARAAFLAWIPPAWGVTRARERFPDAAILRPSLRNRDYYVTRAMAIWKSEVERGGSRLRAAPEVRRRALDAFVADPVNHLFVSALVGWRTLFSERGALAIADASLAMVAGIALHALLLFWSARALLRRDLPGLALCLIPLCGWILHALLTEGRDRFQLPALPVLWLLAAVAAGEAARHFPARRRRRQ